MSFKCDRVRGPGCLNPSCIDRANAPQCSDDRFSNRPFEVKHFQTIHHCSVDVAHGLVLLFGIRARALPAWDPRSRRNDQ